MAALIAAGYKAPLTAVVFVAEATGGPAFIIPTLIGAAVAYAVSGEASASTAQRLHESVKVQELAHIPVRDVMQRQVVSVQSHSTLSEFAEGVTAHHRHAAFPVYRERQLMGTVSIWSLSKVPPEQWPKTVVREVTDEDVVRIPPDCDLMEALRLLMSQKPRHILLVTSPEGKLEGVLTKTDILSALGANRKNHGAPN